MPREYKPDPRKKRYKKYDKAVIKIAVDKLLNNPNAKLEEVSQEYNIHKSVLYRHKTKDMKPQGGQTALTQEAEEYLIENINKCAEWGYPMDTTDLRYIVKMYLDNLKIKHKRFKNNFPGPDFVQSFMKRHKDKISKRICENIKRVRAAVSPNTIKSYYTELEKSLEGVPPSNILNYDETNLSDDPGRKKVLMKRGCKYPERIMNHSKASTSLMMAGTADGEMLPPYVVYKASYLYDTWVNHGPKNTRYNRSSSGWFEGTIFEDWVLNMVVPYFDQKPGRKILIGDNLSSHLSANLIKTCKEHEIDFVFLPANSTHLTQPLDVAFFRPMKIAWKELLLKWKKSDGRLMSTVPKGCFPKLLKLLVDNLKENSKINILAGFRKTGIYPLNVQEILSRLPQDEHSTFDTDKCAIDDSVLEFLKKMRYGTMNVSEPKRKRKLNVVAGKSVSAEEIEQFAENKNEEKAKKTKTSQLASQDTELQPSTSKVIKRKKTQNTHKEDIIEHVDDKRKRKGKKTIKSKIIEKNEEQKMKENVPPAARELDKEKLKESVILESKVDHGQQNILNEEGIEDMPIFFFDEIPNEEILINMTMTDLMDENDVIPKEAIADKDVINSTVAADNENFNKNTKLVNVISEVNFSDVKEGEKIKINVLKPISKRDIICSTPNNIVKNYTEELQENKRLNFKTEAQKTKVIKNTSKVAKCIRFNNRDYYNNREEIMNILMEESDTD